jgi:hypothetical protein
VGTSAGLSCAADYSGYFRNFSVDDGLPGNIISAIYEDESGYLWVTTSEGLSRIDIEISKAPVPRVRLDSLEVSFWNFGMNDGLADVSFKRSSVAKLRSGEVLFGGTFGISSFFPDSVVTNSFIPPVVFTDLKVHNRSVRPKKGSKSWKSMYLWLKGLS